MAVSLGAMSADLAAPLSSDLVTAGVVPLLSCVTLLLLGPAGQTDVACQKQCSQLKGRNCAASPPALPSSLY
jgi:hypothetical protein